MKKIRPCWTCSDYSHHEHRWKWTAGFCGRLQWIWFEFKGWDWDATGNPMPNFCKPKTKTIQLEGIDIETSSHNQYLNEYLLAKEKIEGKRIVITEGTKELHIPCVIGRFWRLTFLPTGRFAEPNIEIWKQI